MRVGIIGIGKIAPLHISALKARGQEIVSLCDTDILRCGRAADQFGLKATFYSDYVKMLDREKLDAVHICTPHYLHAEMICYALRRGVNVLCEKPLAISQRQLDEIEKAVLSSPSMLGVCFQNRFNASVRYVKEFFSGREITSASANLIWCRDEKYYGADEWRGKKATEGGGVMINQAIHSLDVLAWLCGMPETVIAHVSNNSLQGVIDVEDTAYGLFSLGKGRNFVVNATNAAKYCFPIFLTFHAGNDTVELSADNLIVNGKFLTKSDGLPIFGKEEWGVGHINLVKAYYDCLEKGEKFPIDFYEGAKAVRLILKMYESDGKEIKIQ